MGKINIYQPVVGMVKTTLKWSELQNEVCIMRVINFS